MDIGDIKYLNAPAKVLKLSEAIRIGCRLSKERRVGFWMEKEDGVHCCAVGAAALALHGNFHSGGRDKLYKQYGEKIVDKASAKHANDSLSREQVADWLESKGY